MKDDRLTLLLYEQLKSQLNLVAATTHDQSPSPRARHSIHNDQLYRSWLQLKRRKVLN